MYRLHGDNFIVAQRPNKREKKRSVLGGEEDGRYIYNEMALTRKAQRKRKVDLILPPASRGNERDGTMCKVVARIRKCICDHRE